MCIPSGKSTGKRHPFVHVGKIDAGHRLTHSFRPLRIDHEQLPYHFFEADRSPSKDFSYTLRQTCPIHCDSSAQLFSERARTNGAKLNVRIHRPAAATSSENLQDRSSKCVDNLSPFFWALQREGALRLAQNAKVGLAWLGAEPRRARRRRSGQ